MERPPARGFPVCPMPPRDALVAKRQKQTLESSMSPSVIPIAHALLKTDISVSEHMACTGSTRRMCDDEITKYSNLETPYGKVTAELEFNNKKILCNNPFALLWAVAGASERFSSFFAAYLREGTELTFYTDGTRPGNQLRPDPAREYQAILWTFTTLPDWYKNRKHGYFKFAYILQKDVDEIGMSRILDRLLSAFFGPGEFAFHISGMRMPSHNGPYHFVATFGFFVIDEKAAHEHFDVKGAGGTKPCLHCSNVVKNFAADGDDDGYLVGITEPCTARFDRHTPESYADLFKNS